MHFSLLSSSLMALVFLTLLSSLPLLKMVLDVFEILDFVNETLELTEFFDS